MMDFLVRRFVKDFENVENAKVRTAYGMLASITGICCNLLLFGGKLFAGLVVNSISVMADAFNNLSDAASSIIGFVGVRMAEKPADEEHPFGHGRMEYIAAFVVAFLVIQVGFSLLKTAVGKILHPETLSFSALSVGILVCSVLVKLWMASYNRKLGKRINSTVMMATAADALGDVMNQVKEVNGVRMLATAVEDVDMNGLRDLGDQLKEKLGEGVVVIASSASGKVNLIAMATDEAMAKGAHAGNLIKGIAALVGGGGGGRPNMAQAGGKNPAGAKDAVEAAKTILEGQLK